MSFPFSRALSLLAELSPASHIFSLFVTSGREIFIRRISRKTDLFNVSGLIVYAGCLGRVERNLNRNRGLKCRTANLKVWNCTTIQMRVFRGDWILLVTQLS